MRNEEEIKKLRFNLLNQINQLEVFICRKSETITNIEVPIFWSQLPNEINSLRDDIKFFKKEINVIEGQIKLIDWLLFQNDVKFIF